MAKTQQAESFDHDCAALYIFNFFLVQKLHESGQVGSRAQLIQVSKDSCLQVRLGFRSMGPGLDCGSNFG